MTENADEQNGHCPGPMATETGSDISEDSVTEVVQNNKRKRLDFEEGVCEKTRELYF